MDFKKNPKTDFKGVKELNRKEAEEEAEALREGIEYHDYLYYVKNRPEISDALYDKLFHRLQELEKTFPDLQTENSPTRRVGAEAVNELKKVEHTAPMLSLNAALEEKELADFHRFVEKALNREKIQYVMEPKFDGLSVEIVYEEGLFRYGASRGNGTTGEDISRNLKTIRSVPLRLQKKERIPSLLAVRGEVLMSRQGFQRLNKERIEKGKEPFANPRNAAAGTMRQLDPAHVANRPLDIFFYDILRIEGLSVESHWKGLSLFSSWGLKTSPANKKTSSLEKVKNYHRKLAEQRDHLDYEIDGLVIKLDDFELRNTLGSRHRSPRWAMAWKFEPKQEVTALQDIVVQVGRTGKLTPVALLDPVDVGGVTVSRATLHNEDEVKRKDVRSGDTVLDRLIDAGVDVQNMPSGPEEQPLSGKTFVFTGSLPNYTRAEAESLVKELGGRPTSSVSGRTDYVVAGENPGSKLDDAREEGVEILDEQSFKELIGR